MRSLRNELGRGIDEPNSKRGGRLAIERSIIEGAVEELKEISETQKEVQEGLERELELFRNTYNARIEYYRQLQHVSDTVATLKLEGPPDDEQRRKEKEESLLFPKICAGKARQRYLQVRFRECYLNE